MPSSSQLKQVRYLSKAPDSSTRTQNFVSSDNPICAERCHENESQDDCAQESMDKALIACMHAHGDPGDRSSYCHSVTAIHITNNDFKWSLCWGRDCTAGSSNGSAVHHRRERIGCYGRSAIRQRLDARRRPTNLQILHEVTIVLANLLST